MPSRAFARSVAPLVVVLAVLAGCGDQLGPSNRAADRLELTVEGFTTEVVMDTGVSAVYAATAFNESGLEVDAAIDVISSDPSILIVVGDSVRARQPGTAVLRATSSTQFSFLSDSVVVTVRARLVPGVPPTGSSISYGLPPPPAPL